MTHFVRFATFCAVVSATLPSWAQDEEDTAEVEAEATEQKSADGAEDMIVDAASVQKNKIKFFHQLPYCRILEGAADALIPGSKDWESVIEGKVYPLGTSFKTANDASRLVIAYGADSLVEIKGTGSFATIAANWKEKSRAISPLSGIVKVSLPRNLPEGLFKVVFPDYTVTDMAGNSVYMVKELADGQAVAIRCITGSLRMDGLHFKTLPMRAAQSFVIRTTRDHLSTVLYGKRGDVLVRLNQGKKYTQVLDEESEATKQVAEDVTPLDWKLSPSTKVIINRGLNNLSSNYSVVVTTFNERGEPVNNCAFVENRPEVNTGEIGPIAVANREELAKRAASVTEGADDEKTEDVPEEDLQEESADTAAEPAAPAASDSSSSADDLDEEF